MAHDACNLCQSPNIRVFKQVWDHGYFTRNNLEELDRLFDIAHCADCGMVFVQNYFDPEHYKEQESMDDAYAELPPPKSNQYVLKKIIMHCAAELTRPPRILEVGCGFGGLMRLLRDEACDYQAIEPSPQRVAMLAQAGCHVFQGSFVDFLATDPKLFDLIVMDNVLEHIPHPRDAVSSVYNLLEKNGYFLAVTPNHQDVRRWLIPGWSRKHRYVPVDHVNYFTHATLLWLLENHGFTEVEFLLFQRELGLARSLAFLTKNLLEKFLGFYPLGLYLLGRKP